MEVQIVGGGWSGCAAAIAARKQGVSVTLHERTDLLLGTGLVGGIMRNNGRFTATEEAIALGGGELFEITDRNARHRNIEFPGHKHATLYDISTTPPAVTDYLLSIGVKIVYHSRIEKLVMTNQTIHAIGCKKGKTYAGDVFVDATGTAGPMANCKKYGNGCAMCVLRCPSFGGRVSLTGLTGVTELVGKKSSGAVGAMSGSCKLFKESLAPEIVAELNEKGVALVPVPQSLIEDHLDIKACQQYALAEFRDNIVLLDTGHAKLMSPYFEIHRLQQIPGLERARYEDPYSGGQGNSMRFFAMAPRDNTLAVDGVNNLFCAGEKAGLLVGHTEAIVTGTLAGYNAARVAKGLEPVELPRSLVIGDAIAYVREQMQTAKGLGLKYTFSGSVLFERMKELGSYTTDIPMIRQRVEQAGLTGVFA
ncbi:MAG: FAD-dependent oxidoreductase [Clostridia bacterium]|nr:FAD-dependent oxidoreductase [Clostridia bacterium]